jgi:amino acid transporter
VIDKVISYFVEFLKAMIHSYWGIIFSFIIGIFFIWFSIKHPTKTWNLRGWAAGVGFIILSILITYFKFTGKL